MKRKRRDRCRFLAILNDLNNVKLNNMIKEVVMKRNVKDFYSVKEDRAYASLSQEGFEHLD